MKGFEKPDSIRTRNHNSTYKYQPNVDKEPLYSMISIGKVSELDELLYDENWLIVRKPDSIPTFVKHEPLLSPSPELFRKYREAYHAGRFNQEFFDQVYTPQFIEELSNNEHAITVLKSLASMSWAKDVILACYCEDESMCHRSIIAGILLGMGANIDTKPEYRKYFERGNFNGVE